jgi:Tfp pilus assembly protein PilN
MRQINLLPPEVVRRRRARRLTTLLSIGVAGLVVLMLLIYVVEAARLSSANSQLARQQHTNATLQAKVDQLSSFARDQQTLANKRQILASLTQNEVRWSVILSDLATIIPQNVWLTQLTGTVQVQAPGAATTTSAGQPVPTTYGQIQLTGCALPDPDGPHLEVAGWLVRLGVPREFANAYLTLSAIGSSTCPVTFNSSVSLSSFALRRNQTGGARNP